MRICLGRVGGYPVHEVCDCFVAFAPPHLAMLWKAESEATVNYKTSEERFKIGRLNLSNKV